MSNTVFECDRVSNSSKLPSTIFRFTLQNNQILIDGVQNGYSISDLGPNTYFPEEQKIYAKYKFSINNGAYAIVEEDNLPPNTNIHLPLEKQSPVNVFDATGRTVKNLFTFYQDIVVVEPAVMTGVMRFYKFDQASNFFSGFRGVDWAGWDIFQWSISYTDAILACYPNGDLIWYAWDRITGGVIGNLGTLGSGFHNYEKVVSSIENKGLFCMKKDGKMIFFPILGVNSLGTATDMNGEWGTFTHILSYGKDLLAVDTDGNMWLFPVDENKMIGEKIKVGRGWNKYQHITAFGTDLLALGADGIVWRYKFDKDLFWDVTYN
jgi:hypothetical protein